MTIHREPTEYAAEIRRAIKAARRDGSIDPEVPISVTTRRASLSTAIHVDVDVPAEFCWHRVDGRQRRTPESERLAATIHGLIDHVVGEWEDGESRFAFLSFRGIAF